MLSAHLNIQIQNIFLCKSLESATTQQTFCPNLIDSLWCCLIVKIVGFLINNLKYFLLHKMKITIVNASIKRKLLPIVIARNGNLYFCFFIAYFIEILSVVRFFKEFLIIPEPFFIFHGLSHFSFFQPTVRTTCFV